MEALERELAFRRIDKVFDELGDEMLARILLPKGLAEKMDDDEYVEYLVKAFEEHGIPRKLWEVTAPNSEDPAELRARSDELVARLIEPRRERIQYYARKMDDA